MTCPLPQLLTSSLSLHHLRVAACSIGDDSAVSIAKALAQNSTLKTLDLSCNTISDIGAEELGAALKRNSSIKGLLLWNNRVFHTGAEALASGLASNRTLQWLGVRLHDGCIHAPAHAKHACLGKSTRNVWHLETIIGQ